MLSEWGFDLAAEPGVAGHHRDRPRRARGAVPDAEGARLLERLGSEYTYRLDQPTALGRAYGQAYARFAADEYFARTSTAKAP